MIACPRCKARSSKVTDKRNGDGFVRRRRECDECGERFTSYESVIRPTVILKHREAQASRKKAYYARMTPEERSARWRRQHLREECRAEAKARKLRPEALQRLYQEAGCA